MSKRRYELTPEETLDHALADLALLAGGIRRLLHRAEATMPGPGAASSSGSARGFDADDPTYDQPANDTPRRPAPERPTAEQLLARGRVTPTPTSPTTDNDEPVTMTRDEARALNGADAAERAVHTVNECIARIHRDVATINRQLAPFAAAAKPFDPNDVPEDWCPNCYRQGGRRHTESRKSKGRNHWAEGWCDFCGSFLAARRKEAQDAGTDSDGWLPTRKILDIRYGPVGSGRITDQLIASEERKLPKALKPVGTRRRGRSPIFAKESA